MSGFNIDDVVEGHRLVRLRGHRLIGFEASVDGDRVRTVLLWEPVDYAKVRTALEAAVRAVDSDATGTSE